jgi:hypothetical protein
VQQYTPQWAEPISSLAWYSATTNGVRPGVISK